MKRAPELPVDRRAVNGLLVSGLVVVAPLAAVLPAWLLALSALLFGWRYAIANRGWPAPGPRLRVALTVIVMLAVWRYYGTLFGRDAGSALLTALLALKFTELRRPRDYVISVFLMYVLILAVLLHHDALWLAPYLLVAVVVVSANLVPLTTQRPPGPGPALRLVGTMLLQALPLMMVLYVLFPRLQGSLWGLPQDAYGALTGMSDELRPGTINQLTLSPAPAFRVEFEGEPPPSSALYWRTLVLERYDGRTWTRDRGAARAAGYTPPLVPVGPLVYYRVTQEPSGKPWLSALELPVDIPAGYQQRLGHTLATRGAHERLRFRIGSALAWRSEDLAAGEQARNLALPPPSARTRALAQQLRADAASPAAIVANALALFRTQNFVYTLEPPRLGNDPVDEFLFETRRGFCEHYASAFVVLMRAAGLPARVVVGYQGGEFNPTGNYLLVRQSDAHAWAEVWLPEQGWTRVDPTAAIAPERIEYGAEALRRLAGQGAAFGQLAPDAVRAALDLGWLQRLQREGLFAWDALNISWYNWVLDYSQPRQKQLLEQIGIQDGKRWLLAAGLAVLAAVALAVLLVVWRRGRQRPDPVARLYARYCRRLARLGVERTPQEGPLQFAARAAALQPALAADIADITRLYVDLRYAAAPGSVPDARRVAELRRRIGRVRGRG